MNANLLDPLVIPRHLIERILEKFIPEAKAIVAEMRTDQEGDGFRPKFRQALINLKIQNWATLYEDPINEVKVKYLIFMTPQEINDLVAQLKAMTVGEQQEFLNEAIESAANGEDDDIEPMTQAEFDALPEEQRNKLIAQVQQMLAFLLPMVFNYFAHIVHGKSMYQLVAEAKAGEWDSFLKAIQIDKSVLTTIPYFIDLNHRVADDIDLSNLQRQINTYRHKPIFVSRIRYPTLWLVFALLDEMNIFEEFERDMEYFANLCQKLRVYGPPPEMDVVDVESFESRLKDYKKTSHRLLPKPEQRILVKEVSSANSPP